MAKTIYNSNICCDYLFMSARFCLLYNPKNGSGIRTVQGVYNPLMFSVLYNDFVGFGGKVKIYRHFNEMFICKTMGISYRRALYGLILNKKIKAVCNVTNYLEVLKRNKDIAKRKALFRELVMFITSDGAVIIKDKVFHCHGKTKNWSNNMRKIMCVK